jgi:hypothetical protein
MRYIVTLYHHFPPEKLGLIYVINFLSVGYKTPIKVEVFGTVNAYGEVPNKPALAGLAAFVTYTASQ